MYVQLLMIALNYVHNAENVNVRVVIGIVSSRSRLRHTLFVRWNRFTPLLHVSKSAGMAHDGAIVAEYSERVRCNRGVEQTGDVALKLVDMQNAQFVDKPTASYPTLSD